MCGRYALSATLGQTADMFGAKISDSGLWEWAPSYNIAPGSVIPVIAFDGTKSRKIVPMRWGLHPHWKKQPPEGRPLFNARVETAEDKPSFRTPFRRRRALIPANGWFEWEGAEKPKTPFYIREKENDLTAFAAIWDQWSVDEGITLLSAAILTTHATGPVKHLHHRMPVRLPRERWDEWLNWDAKPDPIIQGQLTSDDLEFYAVDTAVNSGRAVGPDLIKATGL